MIKAITHRVFSVAIVFGAAGLIAPTVSYAGLMDINLSPTTLTVLPGQTNVGVLGTLTNTSTSTIYLNSDSLTVPDAGTITDDFFNTPLSLAPGANSGQLNLFSFNVLSTATPGVAVGTYAILGGNSVNPFGFDTLGSANFSVTVESARTVPDPSTLALIGIGIFGLTMTSGRPRKSRQQLA